MNDVRYFRNILFALTAFIWLPASAHCQLETLPGCEALRCAAEAQPSHSPCQDDGCSAIEKSQYHAGQFRVAIPALDSLPVPFAPPILVSAKSLPDEVRVGILTSAPPKLLKTWQFVCRTARPARAPSLAA